MRAGCRLLISEPSILTGALVYPCSCQVDGKKEDVSGMALLIPELNAADLTEQGGSLGAAAPVCRGKWRGWLCGGQACRLQKPTRGTL